MRKSRVSENQIILILKDVEKRRAVRDVCREQSVSEATYYQWKSKHGGMEASDIRRLRELENENCRLKQMYADLTLDNRVREGRALKKVVRAASRREAARYLVRNEK